VPPTLNFPTAPSWLIFTEEASQRAHRPGEQRAGLFIAALIAVTGGPQ
jgi:hypothetical protein